ncbi:MULTISPECIES: hypothetical protein [Bacteroidales]|uniref:hypothetical protein n=1 Tax=Bacteroidales TaxID=171549 RepID=UPI00142EDFE3|nr:MULTISPECIES: hypothetical protein [Bacteroidales]
MDGHAAALGRFFLYGGDVRGPLPVEVWKSGQDSVSFSTGPFQSLWVGVGARTCPDTDS